MKIQDVMLLYDYNYWANRQVLNSAARVTPEQFVAPTNHSYGSLRGTSVHILDAERGWRMLIQHHIITPELPEDDFADLDTLVQRWREEEAAMRAYLAGLADEDLTGLVRYTTDTGEARERVLWHCLIHVVNHGTQHRGEAAAMLTNLGHSPGELDFTVFLNQRAS